MAAQPTSVDALRARVPRAVVRSKAALNVFFNTSCAFFVENVLHFFLTCVQLRTLSKEATGGSLTDGIDANVG
jgi:hypothetical protein